jgi:hypothetical protein
MLKLDLRKGDLVEVRGPAEILATLDERGELEHVPFMPEMVRQCGRRFTVDRRTEKICDTIQYNTGSLRLKDTVLLDDLRCDGSGHDGCQAECRFFWKEAWLRRVSTNATPPTPVDSNALQALLERASLDLKQTQQVNGTPQAVWRCQSTQLLKCTERLKTFDPRPYLREYACGNVSLVHFVKTGARAAVEESVRKVGLVSGPPLSGPGSAAVEPPLNLQPGEWVQVKSKEEIAATLNDKGFNRGLWFDREMAAYCGSTLRVRRRVTQFIDERDGRMVKMKTDAITLEDATCTGDLSLHRWFCPRAIYPYWRECWLRRVEPPAGAV